MTDYLSTPCTAFCDSQRVANGPLIDVALAVKTLEATAPSAILTFDDNTGKVIDLDLRGTTADVVSRLGERSGTSDTAPRQRGRPKLGVVAREVTLLPRHWDWLAQQSGGASQALRRLVDEARRADGGQTDAKAAQERSYRFLSALAGDLPDYEDALRALFAGDAAVFETLMAGWPQDIRDYALLLSRPTPKEAPTAPV